MFVGKLILLISKLQARVGKRPCYQGPRSHTSPIPPHCLITDELKKH